jgi:hypothetical protein
MSKRPNFLNNNEMCMSKAESLEKRVVVHFSKVFTCKPSFRPQMKISGDTAA